MDHDRTTAMREVSSTFAAWKTVNDRILGLQKALDDQASDASVPQLESELQFLQLEAERLLQMASHALLRIKTPRSSNGDSTWG